MNTKCYAQDKDRLKLNYPDEAHESPPLPITSAEQPYVHLRQVHVQARAEYASISETMASTARNNFEIVLVDTSRSQGMKSTAPEASSTKTGFAVYEDWVRRLRGRHPEGRGAAPAVRNGHLEAVSRSAHACARHGGDGNDAYAKRLIFAAAREARAGAR